MAVHVLAGVIIATAKTIVLANPIAIASNLVASEIQNLDCLNGIRDFFYTEKNLEAKRIFGKFYNYEKDYLLYDVSGRCTRRFGMQLFKFLR